MGLSFLVALAAAACLVKTAMAGVLLTSLSEVLAVQATVQHSPRDADYAEKEAKAGTDSIAVTWSVRSGYESEAEKYSQLSAKMCFSAESRKDRGWRKADNDLDKDKSCSVNMETVPYSAIGNLTYLIAKDVPKAEYFVRIYVLNSEESEVGYGQTSNSSGFISVIPVSGRHASLDIATAVFSAFSVVSLFGFFTAEKLKAKANVLRKTRRAVHLGRCSGRFSSMVVDGSFLNL